MTKYLVFLVYIKLFVFYIKLFVFYMKLIVFMWSFSCFISNAVILYSRHFCSLTILIFYNKTFVCFISSHFCIFLYQVHCVLRQVFVLYKSNLAWTKHALSSQERRGHVLIRSLQEGGEQHTFCARGDDGEGWNWGWGQRQARQIPAIKYAILACFSIDFLNLNNVDNSMQANMI